MKLVVQNGCRHILSRKDVESALLMLPPGWGTRVQKVVLYQGQESRVYVTFYAKEGALGLFCPEEHAGLNKAAALEELFLAFACIKDRGDLPERISESARESYRAEAQEALGLGS